MNEMIQGVRETSPRVWEATMGSPTNLAAEVEVLIVDLTSNDRRAARRAGNALARLFDARVPRVLPFGPADQLELRRTALAASDVQEALLLLRDDPKLKQSEWVASVQCQCGNPEGAPLCEAFAAAPQGSDVDEIAAYNCCMELGRLGSPDALDALARLVKTAERPGMRLVAAECLAPHGRREGEVLLREAFDRATDSVRRLTWAMHLTRLGDAEATRFVLDYLQTPGADEPLIQSKLRILCGLFLQGVLEPVDATPEEIRAWVDECVQSAGRKIGVGRTD